MTSRAASMNLLNYFNTFDGLPDTVDNCTLGVGGAPADCRGADTQAEFDRQWPKTVAAIAKVDADVIGVNEIENDGYGPDSAHRRTSSTGSTTRSAPGTYAYVDVDAETGQTNALGTDAIKVGMLYKPAAVTPGRRRRPRSTPRRSSTAATAPRAAGRRWPRPSRSTRPAASSSPTSTT